MTLDETTFDVMTAALVARIRQLQQNVVTEMEHSRPVHSVRKPASQSSVQGGPLFFSDEAVMWLLHYHEQCIIRLKKLTNTSTLEGRSGEEALSAED